MTPTLLATLNLATWTLLGLLVWEVLTSRRHRASQLQLLDELGSIELERVLRLRAVAAKNGQRQQGKKDQAFHGA